MKEQLLKEIAIAIKDWTMLYDSLEGLFDRNSLKYRDISKKYWYGLCNYAKRKGYKELNELIKCSRYMITLHNYSAINTFISLEENQIITLTRINALKQLKQIILTGKGECPEHIQNHTWNMYARRAKLLSNFVSTRYFTKIKRFFG